MDVRRWLVSRIYICINKYYSMQKANKCCTVGNCRNFKLFGFKTD